MAAAVQGNGRPHGRPAWRAAFALLVAGLAMSGCLDTRRGHSVSLRADAVESERFVEFDEAEYASSPALGLLKETLENAGRGRSETGVEGRADLAREALDAVDAKWRATHGASDEPLRHVRYAGAVYRVTLLLQ